MKSELMKKVMKLKKIIPFENHIVPDGKLIASLSKS